MSAIFEQGWREDHAHQGDEELESAEAVFRAAAKAKEFPAHVAMALYAQASAHAAIAQAHYAAANVRAKPAPKDERERAEIVEAAVALVGDWHAERGTDGGRLRLAVNAWRATGR